MNKQLAIALIVTLLGMATIAVGLYVLSQTPAPAPEQSQPTAIAESPSNTSLPQPPATENVTGNESAHVLTLPMDPTASTNIGPPDDFTEGSEPWCEAMMVSPESQWDEKHSKIFAANCI